MYSYARQEEMESQKLDCHLQSRRDTKYTACLLYITSQFMGQHSTTEPHRPGNISPFHHSYWGSALVISLLRDQRNNSPNWHFIVNEWQVHGSKLWTSRLSGIQTAACLPTRSYVEVVLSLKLMEKSNLLLLNASAGLSETLGEKWGLPASSGE